MPDLKILKNRWAEFWEIYFVAGCEDHWSPAERFAAEQLAAAEAGLTAATAGSRLQQAVVARSYSREYWLEVHGGVERKRVAIAQARHVILFTGIGWKCSREWRTTTVLNLAKRIRENREFYVMQILADALQDAGCKNDEWLAIMRDDCQPWFVGAAVLSRLK